VNYLLDANCWIDHFRRGPASNVTAHLAAEKPGNICLCSLVLGELIYGAFRGAPSQQSSNFALIDSLRRRFISFPFDDRAAEEYAKTRALLASVGTPIGPNDLIIAAIAKARGCMLVTHNTREFRRVPDLLLADWE
jgi:tRNA(fMet)-specific endonuclease VapC